MVVAETNKSHVSLYPNLKEERCLRDINRGFLISSSFFKLLRIKGIWKHYYRFIDNKINVYLAPYMMTSRIQEVHSWRSWNFWRMATFKKICIFLRNSDTSSLHLYDPAHEHCSDKWAALTWLHRRHTRSCKW